MERSHTHSLTTRTTHWINAAFILFLLWSGFARFGNDRAFANVRLLPSAFWQALHLGVNRHSLLDWHTYGGLLFAINGALYIGWLIASFEWRRIMHRKKQWAHDSERPLDYSIPQRVAYATIIGGAGLMVLTGAALWGKHAIPWLIAGLGGERLVLPVHVILATSLLGFIAIHLIQVVLAGWPTLRSMTIGAAKKARVQKKVARISASH